MNNILIAIGYVCLVMDISKKIRYGISFGGRFIGLTINKYESS